jgi:hypothetical protein
MRSPSDVLQAAREIRPYLRELLPQPQADDANQRLELILQTATDELSRSQEALALLSTIDVTQEWLRLYLDEHHSAEEILSIIRTYHPLPGKSGAIISPRYCCPVASCHQTWYRRDADAVIPDCPIHGVKLVRESKLPASASSGNLHEP